MRFIQIAREKHFAGSILQYFCVLDVSLPDFKLCIKKNGDRRQYASRTFPISNGKTIEIAVDEMEHRLFAFAFTANGVVYSEETVVRSGSNDLFYKLHAKYDLLRGLSFQLIEQA